MRVHSWLRSLTSRPKQSANRRRGQHWIKIKRTYRPFLELLEGRLCPSVYNYGVVARTGATVNLPNGSTAAGTLTSLALASINDSGNVAFLGALGSNPPGVDEATFVGGGSVNLSLLSVTNINSIAFTSPQIDNKGEVIAQDQATSATTLNSYIRTWQPNGTYGSGPDAQGSFDLNSASGDIVLNPSISPDSKQVAYEDRVSHIVTLYINNQAAHTFPSASTGLGDVIANNGAVVVRDGSTSNSPIIQIGQAPLTIASTATGFSTLGASPGISGDGQVVVFYGNLTAAGATALNAAQAGFTPLAAGPGIFASIASQSHGRVIVEITGVSSSSTGVPGLTPDDRVGVNSIRSPNGQQTLTISYTGVNASSAAELYVSRLTFTASNGLLDATNPKTIQVTPPAPLLGVGDTITGLSGTIQSFNLTSSPNGSGQLAVALTTGSSSFAVVRVPTADITVDSVKTMDSRQAIVDYDIIRPNLAQTLYIQIFRSDQPTYNSADTNTAPVGNAYSVSGTFLSQGHHTVTVPLATQPLPAPANAPVEPLAPDPALPYALAVVVDAQGKVPTNVTVEESQAHFKIFIIGAIVPGFNGSDLSWVQTMRDALQQAYGTDGTTFPFSWQDTSPYPLFPAVRAGDALYVDIVAVAGGVIPDLLQEDVNAVIDVQLIGHSRGASVIGQAMHDLVAYSASLPAQLQVGYYKMTLLDPHPANLATAGEVSVSNLAGGLDLDLLSALLSTAYSDPSITVAPRVNQVEEYYQRNSTSSISVSSLLDFQKVGETAFNLLGVPSQVTVVDTTQTVTNMIDLSGLGLGHSDVHDWYTQNVIPTLANGSPPSPPKSGSGSSGSSGPLNQILMQTLYPQYIDNLSEANALVGDLTTASTDLGQGNYPQAVSDLQIFDAAVKNAPATDFTPNAAAALVSVGLALIGDLGATNVANFTTANAQGANATANAAAADPANNQQILGSITTGSSFTGTAQFSVGNYSQNPNSNPAGQVSQNTFDVQATGLDQSANASASVAFSGQVPTQQLHQAVLSDFGDDGKWHTAAFYNGSAWVQVGPSANTPIQEHDTPVSGTSMSTISLPENCNNGTAPAITGLDGTIFTLTVPAPISLTSLPGGTVAQPYNQAITASGGTGSKTLTVSNVTGSVPGLTIPTGGTNTFSISGTPTAAGTVSFTVRATDSVGIQLSQHYTLLVTTADPTQSTISLLSNTIAAGATTTVTLTAVAFTGSPEMSGGLGVAFSLGMGSGSGTFGSVTDDLNGMYTAVFTGTTAGSNTITATMNGQPVTATASVMVTAGPVSVAQSTLLASTVVIPTGGRTTVTLTARDAYGNQEAGGGLAVAFSLANGAGTFGPVTDKGNGTYIATLTATSPGTDAVVATINNQAVTSAPAAITVVNLSLSQSRVSVTPMTIASGGTAKLTLTARDFSGSQETTGGLQVAFGLGAGVGNGTVGSVKDNGDGTYSATLTAFGPGTNTITATIDGQQVTSTAPITVLAVSLFYSNVTVTQTTIPVGGAATLTVIARDFSGAQETKGGLSVAFGLGTGTGGGRVGLVKDNGDGTYTATFTATTAGRNTLTASIDGQQLTSTVPISVVVPTSPIVTSNPTSQVVSAGNKVSFIAAAAGNPAPTVQWQVSTDGGTTFSNVAGATSATLTFVPAAAQNDNEYRAVFTNSSGRATTAAATLTVNTTPRGLVISAATGVFPQFNLVNPDGSPDFGAQLVALSTGNIVVTDALGAVYLFNGQTGALISALTGTGQAPEVTALTNGNFVVVSAYNSTVSGAVTWGSGTTGVNGVVSAANSLVGITQGNAFTNVVVTPLTNGNYVVCNVSWNNGLGVAVWGNGTTGTTGVISAANSLVGSKIGDDVGVGSNELGVIALANGNYVVDSPYWGRGSGLYGMGAVTWGNGMTGVTGTISSSNSLVGSSSSDTVGISGVIALTNGNYVVGSFTWNGGIGAATWGNGTTGVTGTISSANSLVGDGKYSAEGYAISPLTNGNYVVDTPGDGSSDGGAVTFGNGTTGTFGVVSAVNSLVGGSPGAFHTSVTALTNGNYVVDSPYWNSDTGAVTWGSGTTGVTGTISAANSLVDTTQTTELDSSNGQVPGGGVTALSNGNYVVDSPDWNGKAGAVTWENGTTGITGTVSTANSLVGKPSNNQTGYRGDQVGSRSVTALSNGNYVVDSPLWNGEEGAVTWGNGATRVTGTVSATNSLVGSLTGDHVGGYSNGGVFALPNSNYVVLSPDWGNGEGAATWEKGTTGTKGMVSSSNSLFQFNTPYVDPPSILPNGNFVIEAQGTWVNGTTGTTLDGQNTPDAQNSIGTSGLGVTPISSGSAFVSSVPLSGIVTVAFTDPNLLTYALGQGQTITVTPDFLTRTLNTGTNVTLHANDDITVGSPITETPSRTGGTLTLQAGRSIYLNASISTAGANLSLIANDTAADGVVDGQRGPGNAAITMASGVTLNTGAGALSVDLKKSTDKTNNGSGVVTLLSVTASATTLSSASTLGISINGTTPGNGVAAGTFTQVKVAGTINLNGASLKITHLTATHVGNTFTIVQTSAGVTGTFHGLTEGARVIASDGTPFTISYQGNGAKNVVLTQVAPGAAARFGFATAPRTLTAGVTSAAVITVQLEDPFGSPVNAGSAGQVVHLSTTSVVGLFRNTADTATITSVTIAAGTSTASFKYKDTIVGTPTLTASATGLTSATQHETVNHAAAAVVVESAQGANVRSAEILQTHLIASVNDGPGNEPAGTRPLATSRPLTTNLPAAAHVDAYFASLSKNGRWVAMLPGARRLPSWKDELFSGL
jgi:Repeat of unknown function (DUF5650)/Invasin, domain 3/Immunoglobulin I-set domain